MAPGLGIATWRAAGARLEAAGAQPALATFPIRPATLADFDRLAARIGPLAQLSAEQRAAFVRSATVREVPDGTQIVEHGDTRVVGVLHPRRLGGRRHPRRRRLPRPLDDGRGRLLRRDRGADRQPADGRRVADSDTTLLEVPAEALRATMVVPEIQKLILSTLTSRLLRTESADLPRLAGVDQESLRDLRTPRPSVDVLQRTYSEGEGVS